MIAAEHALAAVLLLGFPLWDVLETRALKTGTNPRRRVLMYQRLAAVLWVCALAAWFTLRSAVFFCLAGGSAINLAESAGFFCLGVSTRLDCRESAAGLPAASR
jgi:hypothetical protein